MGSLDQHTGSHRHTTGSHTQPRYVQYRVGTYEGDRTFRHTHVEQGVWCSLCQWGEASPLHHWKQIAGEHSTYPSCTIPACEEGTATGVLLLESGYNCPAGNTKLQWVGLAQRWKYMTTTMDYSKWRVSGMLHYVTLQLPQGLQRQMQMQAR